MQMVTSLTTKTKALVEEGEEKDIENINFPFDDEDEFSELLSRLGDKTFRKKLVSSIYSSLYSYLTFIMCLRFAICLARVEETLKKPQKFSCITPSIRRWLSCILLRAGEN